MLLWLHCPYLIIFTYVYYIHIMWQHPSRFACAGGFSDLTTSASQDQFPSEKRESEPGPTPQPSMVRPSLALQPNSGTKRCLDHSDMKIEGWRAIFCKLMWLKLKHCGEHVVRGSMSLSVILALSEPITQFLIVIVMLGLPRALFAG